MIFIDSINLSDLYEQEKLEIVLVDHHSLRSKLNQVVTEIIDHHSIETDSTILNDSSKVKIEHVGSCCTLIAEKIFACNANFHKNLRQSTANITGMSIQDLLQKDVKQVAGPNMRLLISSLSSEYTVEKLIGELKTMKDMDEFLSKNDNADGVIILSLETNNDEIKRQLGFYAKKFEHMLPINEYIQREEHNLNLRERGIPINQARIKLFEQRNVQASRKEILPLIEQFIKDFAPKNSS
ncbi:unnamed protein product [Rotaria magnacalcarata]|uniref:inorganic diphosphatase n=1 Tax=Rotaria magnacalcarata TaxID=392030 RepID=A0A815XBZ3_9BILA|nr:unnamed protein product [Rotaria magnacalcarata]CAF2034815.1 unnamed protein product [Rotaria magnacalcarata]CAF2051223.1 unnamed protein product [Rotaria magnacalcarata]CAF2087603.1 unnamed protein product [Rotaria magnacalcarata]